MVIKRESLTFFVIILVFAILFSLKVSIGVSNPCLDMICESGKTCKLSEEGGASCVGYLTLEENGKKALYTFGSCLREKPKYLDLNGKINNNYCYGPDKKVLTDDDCGCSFNSKCQNDGSCKVVCSDGTIESECSKKKPYFCDNGTLKYNSEKCGCPSGSEPSASGKCLPIKQKLFYSANEFANGDFYFANLNSYSFINVAKDKNVLLTSNSCSNPRYLTDSFSSLQKGMYYSFNDMNCKVPDTGESYVIDFGKAESFNKVEINFGYPYILDYVLEYYEDSSSSWRLLTNQHNDFQYNENDFRIIKSEVSDLKVPDEGYIKIYSNKYVSDNANDIIVKQVASYDGVRYEINHKVIDLPLTTSSKIRLIPLNWQQGAKLYEISVYNTDTDITPCCGSRTLHLPS